MKIIKPKKLQKGDAVAIVSPSGSVPQELRGQFDRGADFLKELGLEVRIMKNALGKYYYSSGTIEERLADLREAFADKSVKAVIMSIGGTTANQLLEGLDFDLIRRNPKMFMGISDGTTLLNPIFRNTGIITYHGPDLVFTFGRPVSGAVMKNLRETFFDGSVGELSANPDWRGLEDLNRDQKYEGWRCIRGGEASGKLIGGNVNCLMNLDNTDFRPDYKDKVLFLEAYMMPVQELDTAFTHFRQANVFNEISGLVIGHFYGSHMIDRDQDRRVSDVILEASGKYSFPILEIGELGHNVENYVMPIGCNATIDATKMRFSIDETTSE
ncbi:MAG: S66 peptidase family protein [Candidatus Paceibacterota bacterium]|jgi:muramoyltetrapeptide carboxypeptidase